LAIQSSGLSVSLATTVLLVARHPEGMQQGMLAEEVGVNPGAMVRTLDQAEAASLLQRRDLPGNRRTKIVHATARGKELAARMEGELSAARRIIFGDLPTDAIEMTIKVIAHFEDRVAGYIHDKDA
jgi:MarR family transcriptional regulator for hemolysin